jgi:hypothetical protein
MSNDLTKMSTELLASTARGFVNNKSSAWDRENLRDCITELGKRATERAVPVGYALVPIEHNVADPRHRWDQMCLAASNALRDPGFNSNEMVAAAKAGRWNSSNLVRQIVAAAAKRAA